MPLSIHAREWGYRHAGRTAWALRGVNLDIPPGQMVLLLGASGAGKSTFLHALAGVLPAQGEENAGQVAGELIVNSDAAQQAAFPPTTQESRGDTVPQGGENSLPGQGFVGIVPAPAGSAGLVLQDPDSQLVAATIGDEVAFGPENLGVPPEQIIVRVREALDAVGLGSLPLEHPTFALSGGQKQRLALASVLAMHPALLLLDEPSANVDPAGVDEVRQAIVDVHRSTGATTVIVEHRVDVWAPFVDRVIVLGEHGVIAQGTPDQVLRNEGVRAELIEAGIWLPGYIPQIDQGGSGRAIETESANGTRPETETYPGPEAEAAPAHPPVMHTRELGVGMLKGQLALSGVNLELNQGRALAVLGPNGAGKSTLALTLAGLLPPRQGEVLASPSLSGGLSPHPIRWKSSQLVSRIGMGFQEPESQFLTLSVGEELAFGPRKVLKLSESQVHERVERIAQRLNLSAFLDVNPFTLSGGQKRRLSVASMLISEPQMLILDEPTFGQDARTWAELVGLLQEFVRSGHTLVAVTHDLEFVRALDSQIFQVPAPNQPDLSVRQSGKGRS